MALSGGGSKGVIFRPLPLPAIGKNQYGVEPGNKTPPFTPQGFVGSGAREGWKSCPRAASRSTPPEPSAESQTRPTTQADGQRRPTRPRRRHVATCFKPAAGANRSRPGRGLRGMQIGQLRPLPAEGARRLGTSGVGVISRRSRVRDPALQAVASAGSLDPARLRPVRAVERSLQTVAFDLMECFVCNRRIQE